MAEATPTTPTKPEAPKVDAPKVEVPKQTCQKCRNAYPLDQFNHAIPGQECVCRRCLKVMGYQV